MRDYAVDRLNKMNGVTCHKPEGTYVVFPDITGLGMSSQEAAGYLLEEARMAVVPGTPFWFGPGAEGNIRICLSTAFGILKEGLDRIEQAFAKIHR
jgi:aspartate/methionine/tyrosine aminotransferase